MASELEVGKLGAGVAPAAPLHAKVAATTGTSPLEVARLEVEDNGSGVNMNAGIGPKLSFYSPTNTASIEGASIAAKKESGTDDSEATTLAFSTCPVGGTNTERLRITSTGTATFEKSDGAVVNLYRNDTTITDGNTFGRLQALSGDSNHTAGLEVGSIVFKAYGDQTGTRPKGQIRFQIANNSTQSEAMRIEPTKEVKFYGGINLGDTTLSNYKEGTWTPTLAKGSTSVTSPNTATGRYVRVGKQLFVTFYFYKTGAPTTSGTNNWTIGGLPFACVTGAPYGSISAGYVYIQSTSYQFTSPYRWQTASVGTELLLYGTQGQTNNTGGTVEFSGFGVLEIA